MKTRHQLDRISDKRTNARDTEERVGSWQAKTLGRQTPDGMLENEERFVIK